MDPQRVTTGGGLDVEIRETTHHDHPDLHAAFSSLVLAGEGYPQHPDRPVSFDTFRDYWLAPATLAVVARVVSDRALAGAYTMKPNGPGRAAHVANAGYFVAPSHRGRGLGSALVRHSMEEARRLGFDAMQYNLVFASNPARVLYERLGFEVVGRVPRVIDGEDVLIYWREL